MNLKKLNKYRTIQPLPKVDIPVAIRFERHYPSHLGKHVSAEKAASFKSATRLSDTLFSLVIADPWLMEKQS